ncbi:hypothetical protein TRFO_32304 [Tritrichomonas foetus]|uniref:Uncharacterized protein n=1 Tax=Tritrichomonas foetus TaxID=1144522 RepID=A0A1J4JP63_9EUKA|nr:hypothetical protein [Tritrichomonas foetus]OHT00913.1 hypothetical protein TRFO_32304 [Tritrichomonas foetus]|eukprot:OHT00913.1 hypothetical protein TRFO_32304 [Tritrichomonas foetus]
MIEEYQRGRGNLVKAYPAAQKEPELFHTTGQLPLIQQRCGLYDFPNRTGYAGSPRNYRNLSGNMSSVRDSFSDKKPVQPKKPSNIVSCHTTGAEAVADLTRVCPSYCSSNGSSRSSMNSSAYGSAMIGSPSMLDSRSMSRSGISSASRF